MLGMTDTPFPRIDGVIHTVRQLASHLLHFVGLKSGESIESDI